MPVKLMHFVDFWIGVPLCALLALWHLTLGRLLKSGEANPEKILFIELSEMGSAILAHSSLRKAQELFPDSEIYFLIFERNRASVDLLKVLPHQRVLTISDKSFLSFTISAFLVLKRIRKLRVDTVIDLELFSRFTQIFSYLTGAAQQVGFYRFTGEGLFRGNWLTHKVLYNPHQHMSVNFLSLVCALNEDAEDAPLVKRNLETEILDLPVYSSSEKELQRVGALMQNGHSLAEGERRFIVLNPDPGEALPIRGWPVANYAELLRRLLDADTELDVAIIGLERSRRFAREILAATSAERVVDLTGRTETLGEVVTLLSRSALFVTNDSGPAHFAGLTNTPTIVLFGPETPTLYRPLGDNITTLYARLSCSPCLAAANHRRTFCHDNKCLQAIAVDDVHAEAQKILSA